MELRSEPDLTIFVIVNKNNLVEICGESLPIIVCLENHKDFIAMQYKCNVMTPTKFFSCVELPCDVYLCLPSGKVLDDCIKYFHTLVKKFKCIIMKLKSELHTWPVPFAIFKQQGVHGIRLGLGISSNSDYAGRLSKDRV